MSEGAVLHVGFQFRLALWHRSTIAGLTRWPTRYGLPEPLTRGNLLCYRWRSRFTAP